MRKKMEEEIRAQLMANQEMLGAAEGSGPSWEEKVGHSEMCACHIDYIWYFSVISFMLTRCASSFWLNESMPPSR